MMIKNAWITPHDAGLASLSIESQHVSPAHMRAHVTEAVFPANPTPEHPERHVVGLSLLDIEDFVTLRNAIDTHIQQAQAPKDKPDADRIVISGTTGSSPFARS
jgi:hypothetical protein